MAQPRIQIELCDDLACDAIHISIIDEDGNVCEVACDPTREWIADFVNALMHAGWEARRRSGKEVH